MVIGLRIWAVLLAGATAGAIAAAQRRRRIDRRADAGGGWPAEAPGACLADRAACAELFLPGAPW